MRSKGLASALLACLVLFTAAHAGLRPDAWSGLPAQDFGDAKPPPRAACARVIGEDDFGHGVVRVMRVQSDTARDLRPAAADQAPTLLEASADFGSDTKAWTGTWAACVNHVGRQLSRRCAAVLAGQGAFATGEPSPRKATAGADVYGSLSNLREDQGVQSSGSSGTCPLCLTPPC
jgi:hypothetical protein